MNLTFRRIVFSSLLMCMGYGAFCQAATMSAVQSISANSNSLTSRQPDSRGWTDPALNHNKLFQQQTGDGFFKLVGTYKVTGTSYLFGEHLAADMYATEAKALNIYVSYNTYNQEVEFYSSSNPDKPLIKEPGEVDSFTIHSNIEAGITKPLNFIYGPVIGSKDKNYYQEVCKGGRFTLYKKYKSDLGYSTSNLAQSDLRQFDLSYEYFYTDSQNKGVKKIRPNASSLIKEFKDIQDLSAVITNEDFTANPEAAFCKAFTSMNAVKKGF